MKRCEINMQIRALHVGAVPNLAREMTNSDRPAYHYSMSPDNIWTLRIIPMIRSAIRLMALLVAASEVAFTSENVRVEFLTHVGAGSSLENRYGDYCPTKILWADRIYDPVHVLDPTNMPFTRLEWPDQISDPDHYDPTMFDGRHSQEVIITQLLSRGVRPLVCIRVPPSFKNDLGKIEKFYYNVTAKVASLTSGLGADIELFNEPDLLTLDEPGSKEPGDLIDRRNQEKFFRRFAAAHAGANRARTAHLAIGGPGYALSGFGKNEWMGRFLKEIDKRNFRLDFISYHIYLNWSDHDRLISAPADRHIQRSKRVQQEVAEFAKDSGRKTPPIWITEYAWTIGNAELAFDHCRRTMFNYQHCARTLESFLVGRELAGVQRLYWAQGPGQYLPELQDKNLTGDGATFFSLINYYREHKSGRLSESWRYKAGVPAFNFVNTLPGTRCRVFGTDAVGVIASSDGRRHELAAWSRNGTQRVKFSFPDLGKDLSRYRCELRIVDGTTWKTPMTSPSVPARTMDLDQLDEVTLGHEASLFLTVSEKPDAEEEGLTAVYFNQTDLTREGHRRIDRAINFRWGRSRPAPGIDPETFSVRWTGSVLVPINGNYVFKTESDDGIKVWIDGRLVIDQWNRHREREDRSPPLHLSKGRHRLRVEFFDRYLTAICVLSWQGPGFSMRPVPTSALRSQEP
jgi:hypothetical protein